jgi:hypothetical protein
LTGEYGFSTTISPCGNCVPQLYSNCAATSLSYQDYLKPFGCKGLP